MSLLPSIIAQRRQLHADYLRQVRMLAAMEELARQLDDLAPARPHAFQPGTIVRLKADGTYEIT